MNNHPLLWKLCIISVIAVSMLSFTPLVIPEGVYKPMLGGIPYTLWMSILVTLVLVGLTYLGTKVHPGNKNEDHND